MRIRQCFGFHTMGPLERTFIDRWKVVKEIAETNPTAAILAATRYLQQTKAAYYALKVKGYDGEIFRKFGTYWEKKIEELRCQTHSTTD